MMYVDGSKYEGMFERGLREGLGVSYARKRCITTSIDTYLTSGFV